MATTTTYTGCTACCGGTIPSCCASGSSAFSFSGTNALGAPESASGTAVYVSGSTWRASGTTADGYPYTVDISCTGTNTWQASISYGLGGVSPGDSFNYGPSDLTYDAGTNTFTGSVTGTVRGSGPFTLTFSSPC